MAQKQKRKRIVIVVEGGCVQEVVADHETDVLVIDRDTVGVPYDNVMAFEGQEGYVCIDITEADVDRERVRNLFMKLRGA